MGFYIQDCYWEAVSEQPRKVQQEVVWAATMLYFTGTAPALSGVSKSIFAVIRERVEKAREKAEQKRQERRDGGAAGGAAGCAAAGSLPQRLAGAASVATDAPTRRRGALIESEREGENRFVPPTREEAGAYLESLGLSADLDKVFDHYESNGWRCGRNPMRDWRAAFRRAAREWAKGGHGAGPSEYADAI